MRMMLSLDDAGPDVARQLQTARNAAERRAANSKAANARGAAAFGIDAHENVVNRDVECDPIRSQAMAPRYFLSTNWERALLIS